MGLISVGLPSGCFPVVLLSVGILFLGIMSGRAAVRRATAQSGYWLSGMFRRGSVRQASVWSGYCPGIVLKCVEILSKNQCNFGNICLSFKNCKIKKPVPKLCFFVCLIPLILDSSTGLVLKSDSHIPENCCQIKIFRSLVQKNTIICLFGV